MFKSSTSKKRKRETGTVSSWIESTFSRRDCNRFLPSAKDNSRCCCGNLWQYHSDGSPATLQHTVKGDDHWNPLRHTTLHATDAYGTIEFQGGAHPSKAQYVRVAYDTRPEQLLQLLVSAWRLELPKLLVTVHGGKANFELQPKLKKALRRGLLKAARTTGAWVFTGGTNTGVTRHAGDALASGQSLRLGGQRAVCIGIAPWGVIEGRHEQLVGRNREVPYHMAQGRFSRCAPLNSRHTHFLLADNGTAGRYGAEYIMRRALEKHISNQRYMSRLGQGTPLVCVVIEGGTNTIRAILEYVTDSPPVPVVVCDGTGRASDIVSFVYRHMHSSNSAVILGNPEMREHLVRTVKETFGLARQEQAEKLLTEIIQCCRHKELITVYRYQEGLELDEAMLKALLQGYNMCSTDQLNLALSWNRVDIARCTVFATPQEWPPGSLEQAMMDALVNDRIDFVKLLLENGVMMSKFLTLARLEELYNAKQGPPNSLHFIIQDVRKHYTRSRYTLLDIGLVINHLMGGAYRSTYSRRKFRALYYETFRFRSPMIVRNASMFMRAAACATTVVAAAAPLKMSPPANGKTLSDSSHSPARSKMTENVFEYPFSELMIWAVLTKRQAMAHLMWQHGEEALAKALVACKLFKALSGEAAEDNLDTEFFEDLKRHATEFENLALDVLDFVYQHNQDVAQQLLTYELRNWSRQSCLSLAVTADHKRLLAHPSCQVLLAELWMGGLNLRRNTNMKVLLSVLFPPAMLQLEFRTQEELRQMPQTEEEYMMEHCEEEEDRSDEEDDDPAGADEEGAAVHRSNSIRPHSRRVSDSSRRSSTCRRQGLVPSPSPRRVSVTQPTGSLPLNNHPPSPSGLADFVDGRKNNQLSFRKKVYEFYTAPVTKFWSFTLAYIVFLTLYTFVVLVKMYPVPRWQEIYVNVFIVTAGIEKCREIMISEPVSLSMKLQHWFSRLWNLMDAIFIVTYLMAQPLRYNASTFRWGRSLICCNNMYWHIRLFEIFSVEKYLGPMVTMVGKMTVKMLHFIVLLVIILFSFGVLRQSIRFPNEEPNWYLLRHVFYQPYFMLYGEVYAPEIEPPNCGTEGNLEDCHFWITVVAMAAYLLVANILMLNMMIAVFNNIFARINAVSHEVWMFQRYRLVMEYEVRPVCPPPFIIISHLYMLLKFMLNRCRRDSASYDRGLKLFLDEEALENVHDFEEECLEAYFRQKEFEGLHKTDRLVQQTWERQEQTYQRLDDVLQREFAQVEATRLVDYRLKRLEEMFGGVERLAAATHAMLRQHTGLTSSVPDAPPTRPRYTSTGSVGLDDDVLTSGGGGAPGSGGTGPGTGGGGVQDEESPHNTMVQELAQIAMSHGPRRRRSKLDSSSRMSRTGSSCSQSSIGSVPVVPMGATCSVPPSPAAVVTGGGGGGSIGGGSGIGGGVLGLSEPDGARPPSSASEPPVWPRPEIHVLPPSSPTLDLPMGEYRSITDSLESRCRVELGPVSVCVEPPPPTTSSISRASSPTTQQMLTSAEDGDYQMMESLIQRRMRRPSENLDVSLEDLTRLLGERPAGVAPGGAERRASACPPHLTAVPEDTDNESEHSDMLTFRATPPGRRGAADETSAASSSPVPAGTPPTDREDQEAAAETEPAGGASGTPDPAPSPPPPPPTEGSPPPSVVDSRRSSQCSHQETRC